MDTRRVAITFDPLEVQRAMQVVMDDDREGALLFMRSCLDRKLRDALRPHCVPVFEASYRVGQRSPHQSRQVVEENPRSN